jgi:IS30 family transposase
MNQNLSFHYSKIHQFEPLLLQTKLEILYAQTEEIKRIQDQLNNRPKKRLGLKTPREVFMQSLKRVALRT